MSAKLSGFAFPFRISGGGVARADGFEKIAENVRQVLSTRLGERVMLRNYGGGVHQRLQSPNDDTLRTLIANEIEQALRIYLPQVRLVAPIRMSASESELRIALEYVASPRDVVRQLELQL